MIQRISVAGYLFTRLHQLGVGAVHGVPSDYTIRALDQVAPAGLKWIGNCNELGPGYAADGYARAKGISTVFTTYGVGELSASNAVAGSYAGYTPAGYTPAVHIVGTPARKHQNPRAIVYHSLDNGRMRVFADMARHITAGQVNLIDAESAPDLVDGVLQECVMQSRPVYVEFPSDIVDAQVSELALDQPLDLMPPRNAVEQEDATVDLLLERIVARSRQVNVIDCGSTA
jgi:pyruvate decarboxylase